MPRRKTRSMGEARTSKFLGGPVMFPLLQTGRIFVAGNLHRALPLPNAFELSSDVKLGCEEEERRWRSVAKHTI
jgi:hypothetical protein